MKKLSDRIKRQNSEAKRDLKRKDILSNSIVLNKDQEKENQKKNILNEEIANTIKEIEIADLIFNHSLDANLIDSALYSRQSNERRLVLLLEIAKREEHQEDRLLN